MSDANVRFVALDVHKSYLVVGAVDAAQNVLLSPRRVEASRFDDWARQHLRLTDVVVFEVTTNAWTLYDLLQPLVSHVVVANPAQVQVIANAVVKTDGRDTLALARLLAAHLIPQVWVPPKPVRELRALISHRERLISQRSAAKNRLQSLLQRHHFVAPAGELFTRLQRPWWDALELSSAERLRTRQDLATIDYLTTLIGEVDGELARLSRSTPWAEQFPFLLQLPGIGLITAMTVFAAIGEISRFNSAKALVGYSGLGLRIHASGQVHRSGGITKQGRSELRATLIEAAWVAVKSSPFWQAQFARLSGRIGVRKAIVALARKLLVVIWHVLTARVVDRQADPEAVARKFLNLGTQQRVASRLQVSRLAFVRQGLDQLGLGQTLTAFRVGQQFVRLPPAVSVPVGTGVLKEG